MEEPQTLVTGFDRGVDFKDKKSEFRREYRHTVRDINELPEDDRYYDSKKRKLVHKAIYLVIAMTQLINGSRISEACAAVTKFFMSRQLNGREIVKIAKSETKKYKKDTKEEYVTKVRHRHMIFPKNWIEVDIEMLNDYLVYIKTEALKKRVLNYLLKHHNCNTHSLRYAFINYMLYVEKKEPSIVAKHVGHSNLDQIVRYTQKKESDKLFEMDL